MSILTVVENSQGYDREDSHYLYINGELKAHGWGMKPNEVAKEVIKYNADKLESIKVNLGNTLSPPATLPKFSEKELSKSIQIQVIGKSFKEISRLKDWVNKFSDYISLNQFSVYTVNSDDGFRIDGADWLTLALIKEKISLDQIDVKLTIKEID